MAMGYGHKSTSQTWVLLDRQKKEYYGRLPDHGE